jgi:hypothetical protein
MGTAIGSGLASLLCQDACRRLPDVLWDILRLCRIDNVARPTFPAADRNLRGALEGLLSFGWILSAVSAAIELHDAEHMTSLPSFVLQCWSRRSDTNLGLAIWAVLGPSRPWLAVAEGAQPALVDRSP